MKQKKKIQIVTWTGYNNYGTHLQCYSLLHKIQNLGYDVKVLAPFNVESTFKSYIKYLLNKIGYDSYKEKKQYFVNEKLRKVYKFHHENLSIQEIFTRRQYIKILNETDVFISGSDQIWNTHHAFKPFYFLDFAKNSKRIAYASSLGSPNINPIYMESVKKYLQHFCHIGVREKTAVDVLVELTGRNDIRQVLDPTFLLSPQDWYSFYQDANIEFKLPQKYIFVYLIGKNEEYLRQVEQVKQALGIKDVIVVKSGENPDFKLKDSINYDSAGPKEFLKLLCNATFVCTDSFHATALSINNSINFVVFLRFHDTDIKSQNSRIYDLLENYNLSNRFYNEMSDTWTSLINYTDIQKKLDCERKDSLNFLVHSIEK